MQLRGKQLSDCCDSTMSQGRSGEHDLLPAGSQVAPQPAGLSSRHNKEGQSSANCIIFPLIENAQFFQKLSIDICRQLFHKNFVQKPTLELRDTGKLSSWVDSPIPPHTGTGTIKRKKWREDKQ